MKAPRATSLEDQGRIEMMAIDDGKEGTLESNSGLLRNHATLKKKK